MFAVGVERDRTAQPAGLAVLAVNEIAAGFNFAVVVGEAPTRIRLAINTPPICKRAFAVHLDFEIGRMLLFVVIRDNAADGKGIADLCRSIFDHLPFGVSVGRDVAKFRLVKNALPRERNRLDVGDRRFYVVALPTFVHIRERRNRGRAGNREWPRVAVSFLRSGCASVRRVVDSRTRRCTGYRNRACLSLEYRAISRRYDRLSHNEAFGIDFPDRPKLHDAILRGAEVAHIRAVLVNDRTILARGPSLEDVVGPDEAVRANQRVAVVCADGCVHRTRSAVGVIDERIGVRRPCGADVHRTRHVGGDAGGIPPRESVAWYNRGQGERADRPFLIGGGICVRSAAQVLVCDW